MKAPPRPLLVFALGVLWALGGASAPVLARPRHPAAEKPGPVVVELFTAQGCSSCKEANRLAARLAGRPGLIVLTWPVDYWDYLGWKDTFARPEFTLRQKAFARRLGPQDVYTPQVVVNGVSQVSGDDEAGVEGLIQAADPTRRPPLKIRFMTGGRVSIAPGGRARSRRGSPRAAAVRADVWLARYDPREQDVEVTAGDNRGATVVHRNVVQRIVRLGAWRGKPGIFKMPPPVGDNLGTVVIVEEPRGGPILGAADSKPHPP